MPAFLPSRIFAAVIGLAALGGLAPATAATVTDLVPDDLPKSLSGSYLAGRSADGAHDAKAAISYFESALEGDPDNSTLIERVLLLQASDGEIDAASALAERLVAVDARNPMARLVLTARQLKAGGFADAETALVRPGTASSRTTTAPPSPILPGGRTRP
jgi:hypothetical protein